MYLIDGQNVSVTEPTPGIPGATSGYFKGPDGGNGTQVTADWLNAVQGELINIIERSNLDPTKGTNDQTFEALIENRPHTMAYQWDDTSGTGTSEGYIRSNSPTDFSAATIFYVNKTDLLGNRKDDELDLLDSGAHITFGHPTSGQAFYRVISHTSSATEYQITVANIEDTINGSVPDDDFIVFINAPSELTGDMIDAIIENTDSPSSSNTFQTKNEVKNAPYANSMLIRDEKSSGTFGGTSTVSSWNKRDLNTVVYNNISGASLNTGTSEITLPIGSYIVTGSAPALDSLQTQMRLRNTTNNITLYVGSNGCSDASGTSSACTTCTMEGYFELTATKVIELQQWFNRGLVTAGMGVATSSGEIEVYATLRFTKVV